MRALNRGLAPAVQRRLVAEGNPFYAEQLLAYVEAAPRECGARLRATFGRVAPGCPPGPAGDGSAVHGRPSSAHRPRVLARRALGSFGSQRTGALDTRPRACPPGLRPSGRHGCRRGAADLLRSRAAQGRRVREPPEGRPRAAPRVVWRLAGRATTDAPDEVVGFYLEQAYNYTETPRSRWTGARSSWRRMPARILVLPACGLGG